MSVFLRLLTALVSVVVALCAFLLIFTSGEVVELLGEERKETIKSTVISSMNENRFIFYSGSKESLDDWLQTITAANLIDYAALLDSSGYITSEAGDPSLVVTGEIKGKPIKNESDEYHLYLEVPITFQDDETLEQHSSLVLLIKSSTSAVYKRVLSTIVSVLLFSIVIMIPLIAFLTRWVGKPIKSIGDEIAAIKPETISETPINVGKKTPIEFLPIVDTVNSLLIDIRGYTDNLDSLVEDRTSLLNDALLTLQTNERQKQALISNLSHDLKTPLAAINGYLELVHEQLQDDDYEYVEGNIQKALSNSESMLKEINTILNISTAKLDGEHTINSVSLRSLVLEMLGKHDLLTVNAGNRTHFEIEGDDTVKIHDSTFKHVLDNLISNSNKYTSDGEISINIVSGRVIKVTLKDQGKALSREKLESLFEPKRIQGSARFSLSGMGLFLCKLRIEHAGGSISANPAAKEGLEITFTLPNMGI